MKIASELLAKGEVHEEKGDYQRAERFYKKALVAQEGVVGTQHQELIPYLYNLGMVQCALECDSQGEWTLTRLLTILVREVGEDHEDTREIRSLLAELKTISPEEQAPLVVNA